ncbi:Cysteine-rich RLK (RECEPTOR-like protein kinase) 8, putative, partial [Theobroma cacao]
MEIPQGYAVQGECPKGSKLVCKLYKSLYGLKQASRRWNAKLTASLLQFGFTQSSTNHSLFTMKTPIGNFVALLVYVDDMLIGSTFINAASEVKEFLNSKFKLKDLGDVKYFLGLEIIDIPKEISISQRKYTLDLLEEQGTLGAQPTSTPIDYNHKLQKAQDGEELLKDPTCYRQFIDKLLYLTFSKPDISYAVQTLSQFMDRPSQMHLMAAHRILKYLKNAVGQGILMKRISNLKITAYSDSDWAGCP